MLLAPNLLVAGLLAALAPARLPQDSPEPLLSIECSGLSEIFVADKDDALRGALLMVGERLVELPSELDWGLPPDVLPFLTRLLGGGFSLVVALDADPVEGLPLPIVAELRLVQSSPEAAIVRMQEFQALMESTGIPLDGPPDAPLAQLPTPFPAWIGAHDEDFVVRLGKRGGVPVATLPPLLPEAAATHMQGAVDYGRFLEILTAAMPASEQAELDALLTMFESLGLRDTRYEFALGSDAERQYSVGNMRGFASAQRDGHGLLPEVSLTRDFVRLVPKDAQWASLVSLNLEMTLGLYRELLASTAGMGADPLAQLEEMLGVSVEEDLIAPLGSRACIYASDSTGGGGALSIVAVFELSDAPAFGRTVGHLAGALNELAGQELGGYARAVTQRHARATVTSLTFPGLPIPLELTLGWTAQHAAFGPTPQAVVAALDQALAPGASLLDHWDFLAQLGNAEELAQLGIAEEFLVLQWLNTPRLMRDGYGLTALACSALANAVRSPSNASREPGMILPMFGDLHAGARPIVGIGRVVGDDYLFEYRADRSYLVNATGLAGFLANSALVPIVGLGMGAALMLPMAVEQLEQNQNEVEARVALQREQQVLLQREQKVLRDLRQIRAALDEYAIHNAGRYPYKLEALTQPDENGTSYLPQGALLDPWGKPFGYEPPGPDQPWPRVYSRSSEE